MSVQSGLDAIELTCESCGWVTPFSDGAWCCQSCGSPLEWWPDRSDPRPTINRTTVGPARYAAALPPIREWITLGDSPTPISSLDLDGHRVSIKLDSLCPTGSFKDRGNAVVVSALRTLVPTHFFEDSSGNAASSLAGFAARAGIPCTVYAPATASAGKLVQARAYGAEVIPITGSRAAVAEAAYTSHDPDNWALLRVTQLASVFHRWRRNMVTRSMGTVRSFAADRSGRTRRLWQRVAWRFPDVAMAAAAGRTRPPSTIVGSPAGRLCSTCQRHGRRVRIRLSQSSHCPRSPKALRLRIPSAARHCSARFEKQAEALSACPKRRSWRDSSSPQDKASTSNQRRPWLSRLHVSCWQAKNLPQSDRF